MKFSDRSDDEDAEVTRLVPRNAPNYQSLGHMK